MPIMVFYLIAVNIFGFGLMWLDKNKARQNQWRVPEATLHLVAWLGAAPAMLWARDLFRHKTKKPIFGFSFTVASILWLIIVLFFL